MSRTSNKIFADSLEHRLQLLGARRNFLGKAKVRNLIDRYKMVVEMRHFKSHHRRSNSPNSSRLLNCGTYSLGRLKHSRIVGVLHVHEIIHLHFRNHERVAQADWKDIQESDRQIVLKHFIARNFPADNFREDSGQG